MTTRALQHGDLESRGWVAEKVIGKGCFGTVIQGHSRQSPERKCIIKEVRIPEVDVDAYGGEGEKADALCKLQQQTLQEVTLLRKCQHLNIVKYYDSFFDEKSKKLNIIMQLCEGRDLSHQIGKVDEPTLWSYLIQTLQGLKYLHENRILHRDIKPTNLLLTADRGIRIADMGLSKMLTATAVHSETYCGTPLYQAPEQHAEDCRYDQACDIWSAGCTFYELAAGKHPFHTHSMAELLRRIREETPPVLDRQKFTPELSFLLLQMLQKQRSERLSADSFFRFHAVRTKVQMALWVRQWKSLVVENSRLRRRLEGHPHNSSGYTAAHSSTEGTSKLNGPV